jgi:hypothetical protein
MRFAHGAGENGLCNVLCRLAYQHTWVFDDERVGLVREPFVSGIPEMMDTLVQNIPISDRGCKLLLSAHLFPGYQTELLWW